VAVVFAALEVGVVSEDYPAGYERLAWITAGLFAVGAVLFFFVSKNADVPAVGLTALVFDTCIIAAFVTISPTSTAPLLAGR